MTNPQSPENKNAAQNELRNPSVEINARDEEANSTHFKKLKDRLNKFILISNSEKPDKKFSLVNMTRRGFLGVMAVGAAAIFSRIVGGLKKADENELVTVINDKMQEVEEESILFNQFVFLLRENFDRMKKGEKILPSGIEGKNEVTGFSVFFTVDIEKTYLNGHVTLGFGKEGQNIVPTIDGQLKEIFESFLPTNPYLNWPNQEHVIPNEKYSQPSVDLSDQDRKDRETMFLDALSLLRGDLKNSKNETMSKIFRVFGIDTSYADQNASDFITSDNGKDDAQKSDVEIIYQEIQQNLADEFQEVATKGKWKTEKFVYFSSGDHSQVITLEMAKLCMTNANGKDVILLDIEKWTMGESASIRLINYGAQESLNPESKVFKGNNKSFYHYAKDSRGTYFSAVDKILEKNQ